MTDDGEEVRVTCTQCGERDAAIQTSTVGTVCEPCVVAYVEGGGVIHLEIDGVPHVIQRRNT